MNRWYNIDFDQPEPLKAHLEAKTIITSAGFGTEPATYPVTIVPARYSGSYEGATWLAFPVYPEHLTKPPWDAWDGDDIECMTFWSEAASNGWPIGYGNCPDQAYRSLLERLASRAGVDLDDLTNEPTWDKDKIGSFDDDPIL